MHHQVDCTADFCGRKPKRDGAGLWRESYREHPVDSIRLSAECFIYIGGRNPPMTISEQIEQHIKDAMRARDEHKLTTLRMVKSALKSKEIDKRAPLDEKETLATLSTLIKQRKDSVEQFTKGGRPELAAKEEKEIALIESYMPKAVGEAEVTVTVKAVIAEMGSPTIKDMGNVMKATMAKFGGARVDGKLVSETVKRELSGK